MKPTEKLKIMLWSWGWELNIVERFNFAILLIKNLGFSEYLGFGNLV
jgi:hypothetical protein